MLDIGSNSAQLQIIDLAGGSPPLPAHSVKNPTLLSEEITEAGAIGPTGIQRVCPWALREGIMLRHLETLKTVIDLPLYPLESVQGESSTVTTLPTAETGADPA